MTKEKGGDRAAPGICSQPLFVAMAIGRGDQSLWTMMSVDYIGVCSEEHLEVEVCPGEKRNNAV